MLPCFKLFFKKSVSCSVSSFQCPLDWDKHCGVLWWEIHLICCIWFNGWGPSQTPSTGLQYSNFVTISEQALVYLTAIQWNLTNSKFAIIQTTYFVCVCVYYIFDDHSCDHQARAEEQCKSWTQTKINLFFLNSLSNTTYVGYLKCFYDWCQNLQFHI